jgi:predicted RecA/RadA family phage recombinase
MNNYIAAGRVMDYTNGTLALIPSGSVAVVGGVAGIAVTDIAVGDVGAVNMDGAYQLPQSGFTGVQGQRVYWDTTAGNVTATGSATTVFLGVLYYACAHGDATCVVNLIGSDQPGQALFQAASVAVGSPSTAEFNALLVLLQNAGLMATS